MKPVLPLIFERSVAGRIGYSLPPAEFPLEGIEQLLPQDQVRQKLPLLPEVSEGDVIRHYINLSLLNHNIDRGFYPLGSCTMKYNPKVNEDVSRLPGFARLHPLVPEENAQGALELIYQLEQYLAEISGMDAVSLQPVAGAHGNHRPKSSSPQGPVISGGEHSCPRLCPAPARQRSMVGMKVVQVASDANGCVSLEDLGQD